MTVHHSRIVVTGEGTGVRARLVPDAAGCLVIELTHLERHRDGYTAERARVFVPIDRVEDFTAAIVALRAEKLLADLPRQGRLQMRAAGSAKPKAARSHRPPQCSGEF
jgi:hypothetical protein